MKCFAIALVLAAIGCAILAFANVPYIGWGFIVSSVIPLGMSLAEDEDPLKNLGA